MSSSLAAAQHGTEILLGLGTTLVVVTGILVTVRVVWDVRATGKLNADDCEFFESEQRNAHLSDKLLGAQTFLSPPSYS